MDVLAASDNWNCQYPFRNPPTWARLPPQRMGRCDRKEAANRGGLPDRSSAHKRGDSPKCLRQKSLECGTRLLGSDIRKVACKNLKQMAARQAITDVYLMQRHIILESN